MLTMFIIFLPWVQSVCCLSEDKEVLYSIEAGFRCCGHLYYNSSLWSCCAGKLSPLHHPGQHQNKLIDGQLCAAWTLSLQNGTLFFVILAPAICVPKIICVWNILFKNPDLCHWAIWMKPNFAKKVSILGGTYELENKYCL